MNIILRTLIFAAVLNWTFPVYAQQANPPAPQITQSQSFCPSGCDSTATSFTVPSSVYIVYASYCSGGGGGSGGGTVANVGGGGGGGAGICYKRVPLYVAPGTILALNYTASPAGPAAATGGLSGFHTNISLTSGTLKFVPPTAWPGGGGLTATATGGNGGQSGCANDNNLSCGTGVAQGGIAGGAGGATTGSNGLATAAGGDQYLILGTSGGGGGGTSTGGGSRCLSGTVPTISGGAGNATDGGGGAGGCSGMGGIGGTGGTQNSANCTAGTFAAGGGGGGFNEPGCKGGDPIVVIEWAA